MANIWSTTWHEAAASNNTASPDGWATGALPSTIKSSGQEMMAALKRDWNLSHPTLTTGGTGTAYTLSPSTALDAYVTGQIFAIKLSADLGANATLNVSALGAKKIYLITRTTLAQPVGGEAKSGHRLWFYYDAALDGAAGGFVAYSGLPPQPRTEAIGIGITTETGLVATGTGLATFRMPYAFTLSSIKGSLKTAQASGSILTIDVKKNGTTVFSTLLTIDNTEKTTVTAATAAVLSTTSFAADDEITADVTQIGNGTAAGLKLYFIGKQT